MDDKSQAREMLKSLAEDVAETASYLRELGVEGLEGLTPESAAAVAPPVRAREEPTRARMPAALSPALKRNASAERPAPPPQRPLPPPPPQPSQAHTPHAQAHTPHVKADTPPGQANTPSEAHAPQSNEASRLPSILHQKEMPKKPVRKPSPDPPEPRLTLFGEITPQDDLSLGRPGETFDDIREDIGECVRCPLHQGRTKIVHTEGNQKGRLLFVGEAPGADEDASGRPFVGRAGQLLNKIIEAIGLKREDILIGNVNRCRPPNNRTPTTEEARTCKPFLLREIN
ncbi:MAG: uracil-DNA glycosylase, partial [Acidobacteriota bacterium]|nr:uracil-DNA glycosylase [Acidobacteriota bacterium]